MSLNCSPEMFDYMVSEDFLINVLSVYGSKSPTGVAVPI